jgi:hypothetical protein
VAFFLCLHFNSLRFSTAFHFLLDFLFPDLFCAYDDSFIGFLAAINTEYVDHVCVRAAEAEVSLAAGRELSTVTQNVHIGEGHMHGHRAKVPPLGIKVEAVPDLMSPVTAPLAHTVNQGEGDFRTFHWMPPVLSVTLMYS